MGLASVTAHQVRKGRFPPQRYNNKGYFQTTRSLFSSFCLFRKAFNPASMKDQASLFMRAVCNDLIDMF